MTFSIPNWAKPALTVVYAATGWIVTEIPVVIGLVPSTFDGVSTTNLVAGLSFILAGSYYVHSHLRPYLASSTTVQAVAATTAQPHSQASQSPAAANPAIVAKFAGQALSVSGSGFAPSSSYVVDFTIDGVGSVNVAGGMTSSKGAFTAAVNQAAVQESLNQAGSSTSAGYVLAYNVLDGQASNKVQASVTW